MKVNVHIPDALYETYVKNFGIPGLYSVMKRAFEAFKDVPAHDRYIFVAGDDRRAIEAVFQTTIESAPDLAKRVKNLSNFAIGGVAIDFTEAELMRMDMQATFHGISRDTYIKNMAQEIKDRMLENV